MHILIVDDNAAKQEAIRNSIQSFLSDSEIVQIEIVDNLSEAVALCSQNLYDLIVLDLLLPYLPSGEVDHRAGLELLRVVRKLNGKNCSTPVLGLSAHPEEILISRFKFEGQGVLLIGYDDSETWKQALGKILLGVTSRKYKENVDFVIIVALLEERQGLEEAGFITLSDSVVNGLKYPSGEHPGRV